MAEDYGQTLAVFVLDKGKQSRRLLKRIQEIDDVDPNVKIVDAAIADRTRFGRVKVHQTTDLGGAKGTARGAGLGVIVGALVAGPAGAVVGGAAIGVLNGLRNRFHDIGIDDKFMRKVTKEVDKGKSALFILYEGSWANSIGMIEQALASEKALLIESTLPAKTATALKALVDPAVEELGGEEVVADYEVEVPEEVEPAEAAPGRRGAGAGARAGREAGRHDAALRRRAQGQRGAGGGGDHDLCRPGRGQRTAGQARAAFRGHGAARQRRNVADAGQLRRERRLAGPDEVQQAAVRAEAPCRGQVQARQGRGRG